MAKKYDKSDLIEHIVCDILNGVSRYRILKKLEKDAYEGFETSDICRSNRYKIIKAAYDECKVPLAKDKQKMRELQLARLDDILEECRDQNDRNNAINAIKETNKLLGLYEAEKVELTGKMEITVDFGLEDKDE